MDDRITKYEKTFVGEFTVETAMRLFREVEADRLTVSEIVLTPACVTDMLRSEAWDRFLGSRALLQLHEGRTQPGAIAFLRLPDVRSDRQVWIYSKEAGLRLHAREAPEVLVACTECGGRGWVDDPMEGRGMAVGATMDCPACDGRRTPARRG